MRPKTYTRVIERPKNPIATRLIVATDQIFGVLAPLETICDCHAPRGPALRIHHGRLEFASPVALRNAVMSYLNNASVQGQEVVNEVGSSLNQREASKRGGRRGPPGQRGCSRR